jgi:nucleotide-binding universal stress UspA family protein
MSAVSPIGQELDGFVLGDLVHSGRMGRVYRVTPGASRGAIGFPLLMKVPRTERGAGAEGLLAFETEVSILPLLSGPHVPRFVAAGDLGTTPYIVVEWIDGQPLQRVLDRERLTLAAIGSLGAAIADALHSLHLQGAIHQDLKPDNIIVRDNGSVVLIDFGMAHHAHVPDLLAEEKRFAAGSAPYVSPEQVLGQRSDPRSDLFALGVMLYEMATENLPFGSPRTLAGLADRLWLDPVPPRERAAELPRWFQEIVLRCLEPTAERRYQSAAHVAFDLRHVDQVPLTERASKIQPASLAGQVGRWWRARHRRMGDPVRALRSPDAPVIMVAVDTMHTDDARHPAIRQAAARILSQADEFRLICVSVVRGEPIAPAADERGIHLEHLIRLRHWVDPLRVAPGRLSLHVIEALNPARSLLDFARDNNVDLIVIGGPGPSQPALAWWRSVASSVTANAHCSVHLVRIAEAD